MDEETLVKLPKSIIASVRRAKHSAVRRVNTLNRKIEEFDNLLRQYGEDVDAAETAEAQEEETEVEKPRRRKSAAVVEAAAE